MDSSSMGDSSLGCAAGLSMLVYQLLACGGYHELVKSL
jgi:hypothetical protein